MVIVNRTFDVDAPCFNIDNREAAGQAMKYLIQNGHEKIALYSNDKNRQYNQERLEGCMEAWSQYHQEHNLTVIRDVTSEEDAVSYTHLKKLFPYLLIAPNALIFTIFIVVPACFGFYFSLTEWQGIGTPDFIGLANYVKAFADAKFWRSFTRTRCV